MILKGKILLLFFSTFVMSLKISEEELDKKSNFKILEMGKYNFQTDVVSMQVKT